MSTKDNEINRNIDADTEGHKLRIVGEAEDAGKVAAVKRQIEDADTEGHRIWTLEQARNSDIKASKKQASLDDEAEGHAKRI